MMITALVLLLQSGPAGQPECDQEASDQGIQQEMNICAAAEYREADAALNAQWAVTSARMKERDEGWKPDWDRRPGHFTTLLESQRAWLRYRDAHCRLDGYYARGGSLEPLLVSTCKTGLTILRTEQLKELAERGP
ncbi:DUF1311 domain-containing protein [Erythrobacter insulae]|uniref:DUF1311 domain-containing protein n=1 Tax=Erythrobacter insulae TaxID=2584124 RepID=A0A547P7D0_9SPHN|nr:lysozyme inhibitor LprI family protein [Erythrobacter insulae]TRD10050.1 DUF1311 domain-containing protein [Erythrobacter insulae]